MTSTYDGKEGQGCYTRFLKLKKAKMDAWTSAYETQQKKIKEEKQWINQNKAKPGVSSQRQQREAKLEKLLKVRPTATTRCCQFFHLGSIEVYIFMFILNHLSNWHFFSFFVLHFIQNSYSLQKCT
jgi:outer membrane protein OmpA-like peptidoglycan-associated protein